MECLFCPAHIAMFLAAVPFVGGFIACIRFKLRRNCACQEYCCSSHERKP